MGRATASNPDLAGIRPGAGVIPALRVITTPADEVDVVCRLTLANYLTSGEDILPSAALNLVLGGATAGPTPTRLHRLERGIWETLSARLDALTVLDPACGKGHFLIGMLHILDELVERVEDVLGRSTERALRRRRILTRSLYGIDVQPGPLREAAGRLRGAVDPTLPASLLLNVRCIDTLLAANQIASVDAFPGLPVARFDVVIGNPPYVRHEAIVDPRCNLEPAEYKRAVLDVVYQRWPDYFGWDASTQRAALPLGGRSDLCVSFLLLACSLLTRNGALGMLLPAGLFQAEYGKGVRAFLSRDGWDSWAAHNPGQGSRIGAHVNTAMVFVQRQPRPTAARGGFRELQLTHAQPTRIWEQRHSSLAPAPGLETALLDTLRGLTALGKLARVRYPIKTGLNAFFYPSAAVRERFGIEARFCRPVLKSPRDVQTIAISAAQCTAVAFVCDLDQAQLAGGDCDGAREYIAWASQQRTTAGTLWLEVRSIHTRHLWYRLPLPEPATLVCPRFYDQRFFAGLLETGLIEDQTFYGLILSESTVTERELLAALLNSSFTALALESGGRTGLGDGVRQYALRDLASLPVIPPSVLSATEAEEALTIFRSMMRRRLLPVRDEVEQADRLALDEVIGRAAGISTAEQRQLRRALVASVDRRLERARQARRHRLTLAE